MVTIQITDAGEVTTSVNNGNADEAVDANSEGDFDAVAPETLDIYACKDQCEPTPWDPTVEFGRAITQAARLAHESGLSIKFELSPR
jgi:sugar/nucleoside kinase (ribokinase family)